MIDFSENTKKYINKITNGNCKEVLANFDANTIDIVITSPPYDDLRDYTNDARWNYKSFQEIAKLLFKVIKPGGLVVWVVGDKGNKSLTSFRQAIYFQEIGFNMYDVIIYEKTGAGPPHKNRYFNTYEYMFILSKGLPKTINLLKDKPNKWANKSTYGNVTRREKDGSLTDKGIKVLNEMGVRTNI